MRLLPEIRLSYFPDKLPNRQKSFFGVWLGSWSACGNNVTCGLSDEMDVTIGGTGEGMAVELAQVRVSRNTAPDKTGKKYFADII